MAEKVNVKLICKVCGTEFYATSANTKYCHDCRQKAKAQHCKDYRNRKKLGEFIPVGEEIICEKCGKPFKKRGCSKLCVECSKIARAEWTASYVKERYDQLNAILPKGYKDTIKQYAEDHGLKVNMLVMLALSEYMENH